MTSTTYSSSIYGLTFIIFIVVFVSLIETGSAQNDRFTDVRCKCVCPPYPSPNGTKLHKKILSDPKECKCINVVNPLPANPEAFCDKCECKWERRNTTTIKVVVIIIICIISVLVLYMLFLLCLDPLMSRRPRTYLEQQNEEVNLDTQSVNVTSRDLLDEQPGPRSRQNIVTRVKTEVSRVRDEQQKWKGQVQEQRKHIYDKHIILN